MYNAQGKIRQSELVINNMDLVRRQALHIRSRLPDNVDLGDLIQAGNIGLIEAAERYDVSEGVPFELYAKNRIRGAILDETRKFDWVSRSVRRAGRELEQAKQHLLNKHNRAPTLGELADYLEIDVDKLSGIVHDVYSGFVLSIEDTGNDEIDKMAFGSSFDSPLDALCDEQNREYVVNAIAALPLRERQIMALYYDKELNFKEIGLALGISESRVSQIHTSIVKALHDKAKAF
ncbi:RNA polymerase sigma factor FliA [Pseudomonas aeruginosa]